MGAFDADHEIPIIVRGEGCYVFDQHGSRYLDGLAALYCVNIGHGRADVAQAGADQAQGARLLHELGLRAPEGDRARGAHRGPRARRPQPRLLHLRRLRGGRLGAQALPPVPQAHRQRRALQGHLAQARLPRHDDGRADRDRHPRRAAAVRAAVPRLRARRRTPTRTGPRSTTRPRRSASGSSSRGPRPSRCVILEPVQNSGGCFGPPRRLLPARARDLRRVRDPVHLRRGDLLVGPAGRVVRRRALRLRAGHHHDGQGPHLVLRADGRGDRLRPRVRAVRRPANSFLHGITFGGHPCPRRSRWPTSTCSRTRTCSATSAPTRRAFGAMLDSLRDIPIVGDVRGMGYFWAIELVSDQATKETFTEDECDWLLRDFLSAEMFAARADLPRRRPRRPGDPARAAADRRARAVRGDPRGAAPRARGGLARGSACAEPAMLLAPRPDPRPRHPARRRRGGPRPARPLGPHLRAGRPDAVAVGRRAAAHDRDEPRRRREPARVRRAARGARPRRARPRRRLRARRGARRRCARPPRSSASRSSRSPTSRRSSPITEKAFSHLVNEQYAVLQRALSAHERLERIVLSEQGLEGVTARSPP